MLSYIPKLWEYLKGPVKSLHDYLDPIPEDEEYGLLRKARQRTYDTMYDHLLITPETKSLAEGAMANVPMVMSP